VGVFHEKKFEVELAELGTDSDRLDDAMRGVEQQLSEEPTAGLKTRVPGLFVKRIKLPGADGSIVRASILYTFNGDDVTYQRIQRRQ
jgi:hypothetical protein